MITTQYWALILVLMAGPAGAQDSNRPVPSTDIRDRLQTIETSQKRAEQELQSIRQELAEMRRLLAAGNGTGQPRPPTPPLEPVSISGAPTKGQPTAPLAIIEFSDFECPFCGGYARDTFPQLDREYIQTGKLLYVFRHLPLEQRHPHAFEAAVAAECAGRQNKFWEMHDQLMANQKALETNDLLAYATAVGVSLPQFQECLKADASAKVRADVELASTAGIAGTPTFLFGSVEPDGRVRIRRVLAGTMPYQAMINQLTSISSSTRTSP